MAAPEAIKPISSASHGAFINLAQTVKHGNPENLLTMWRGAYTGRAILSNLR
jgi:hypothetical protein